MHTDRKIGFAMGILLIGIVAALFFRNEPLIDPQLPTVRREKELNERLRERDVAVYLNDSQQADPEASEETVEQQFTLKDVLRDMNSRNKSLPSPVGAKQRADESAEMRARVQPADTDRSGPETDDDRKRLPTPLRDKSTSAASRTKSRSRPDDEPVPLVPVSPRPVQEQEPSEIVSAQSDPKDVEPQFEPPAEFDEYVVKYGDTLSGIAQKFLGAQSRYKEIFEANRDRMQSPDRLDVGKPLRIPRIAADPSNTY